MYLDLDKPDIVSRTYFYFISKWDINEAFPKALHLSFMTGQVTAPKLDNVCLIDYWQLHFKVSHKKALPEVFHSGFGTEHYET